MKVYVDGVVQPVALSKTNFLAGGGEGDVYVVGGTAYKVYRDAKRTIPEGKLIELAEIRERRVLKPERLLRDEHRRVLGYTMPFVSGGYALCPAFTRAFRDRNRLGTKEMRHLVRELIDVVRHVHDASVLIVDLNEMNILLSPRMDNLWLLDADSYQTPHYPATAIMDSIRDRHATTFSEGTDWFSFAVLSFQMQVGIHPYRGTHPKAKGLEERMKARLSVLRSEVRIPGTACYPLDVLASNWRGWYEAVLDGTERSMPPLTFEDIVRKATAPKMQPKAEHLVFRTIFTTKDGFVAHTSRGTRDLFILREADGSWRIVEDNKSTTRGGRASAVTFSNAGRIVAAAFSHNHFVITGDIPKPLVDEILARDVIAGDGCFFIRTRDHILAVGLRDMATTAHLTQTILANVLEHATKLYEGLAVQNMLGTTYLSILQPTSAPQLRVPELDGCRIVAAKRDKTVAMFLVSRTNGGYDNIILRFDEEFTRYDLRTIQDVEPEEPNFVVLDTGVCVALVSDALEISSAVIDKSGLRRVEDKALGSGKITLFRYHGKLAVAVEADDGITTLSTLTLGGP